MSGVLELQEALLLRMEHPRVIQSIGDLGTGAIEILVKKKNKTTKNNPPRDLKRKFKLIKNMYLKNT